MHKHHIHLQQLTAVAVFCAGVFLAGCQANASQPLTNTPTAISSPSATLLAATPTATIAEATRAPSPTSPPTVTPIPTATPLPAATPLPSSTPTPIPGATQIADSDGMVLRYVPAGEFILGSKTDDVGADADEFPQRSISLDAFWIDQTEVTNAMFATFLNATGGHQTGEAAWFYAQKESAQIAQINGQWQPIPGKENHPVVEVTWHGANAYCTWAGRHLPTEAEWEKAARGSDGRTYPWGEEIDCSKALYGNCGQHFTSPVGSLLAGVSPYGALDMAGNVWEWVADWYAIDTYANMPTTNPSGPESGTARVVRGGSFDYNAKHNRSTDRRNDGPGNSSYDYGFRCAVAANALP